MTTKQTLVAELLEEGFSFTDNLEEAIYILEDGKMVWGDFDYGSRCTDHRMMECFIDGLNRYDGEKFWYEVYNRFNVVMMIPETRFAMYKKGQPLSDAQKAIVKASGYDIEEC